VIIVPFIDSQSFEQTVPPSNLLDEKKHEPLLSLSESTAPRLSTTLSITKQWWTTAIT
jgi:hypothetical protein